MNGLINSHKWTIDKYKSNEFESVNFHPLPESATAKRFSVQALHGRFYPWPPDAGRREVAKFAIEKIANYALQSSEKA
ncbi:hypothetical protein [Polaromonas sp. DSR2-3-2]|uniref:hypothetical protein n=1 Tax=unclassified Polaromonas TaxID=2638319 RepID=UPI003CEDA63C